MAPGGVACFADLSRRYVQPRFAFHLLCADRHRTIMPNLLAITRSSRQPRGGSAHESAHGVRMIFRTWADLLAALDDALTFAKNLQLDAAVSASRFTSFRNRLAELADIREHRGDGAAFTHYMAEIDRNSVALTESEELVGALSYLQSISLARARSKLQAVLQGPELPADEDANSNYARNTMFELNLAARLTRAGMSVEPTGDADLEFMSDGIRWFGECKRPYRLETVESNLRDACRQLGERLAECRLAARGLLAISLSRPVATRVSYLEYSDPRALRHNLRDHVRGIVQLIEERMQEITHCRSVSQLGLLVGHLIIPAWDVNARLPTSVQQTVGTDICRDGRGDGARLWRIVRKTFTRG